MNYRVHRVTFSVCREALPSMGKRRKIDNPALVAELARTLIPDDAREHFVTLFLDSQNRLVATHEVSVGSLSASLVHPREVFGPALRLLGVASLILVHNHPSGECTPSAEDIRLTRQLVDAGKLLEITVHDHVIIAHGDNSHVSLAERGMVGK